MALISGAWKWVLTGLTSIKFTVRPTYCRHTGKSRRIRAEETNRSGKERPRNMGNTSRTPRMGDGSKQAGEREICRSCWCSTTGSERSFRGGCDILLNKHWLRDVSSCIIWHGVAFRMICWFRIDLEARSHIIIVFSSVYSYCSAQTLSRTGLCMYFANLVKRICHVCRTRRRAGQDTRTVI